MKQNKTSQLLIVSSLNKYITTHRNNRKCQNTDYSYNTIPHTIQKQQSKQIGHQIQFQSKQSQFNPSQLLISRTQKYQTSKNMLIFKNTFHQFQSKKASCKLHQYTKSKLRNKVSSYHHTINNINQCFNHKNTFRYKQSYQQNTVQPIQEFRFGPLVKKVNQQNYQIPLTCKKFIKIKKLNIQHNPNNINNKINHSRAKSSLNIDLKGRKQKIYQTIVDQNYTQRVNEFGLKHKNLQSFQNVQNTLKNNFKKLKTSKRHQSSNQKLQKQIQLQQDFTLEQMKIEEIKYQIPQDIQIRKPSFKKQYFVFGLGQRSTTLQNKIQNYRDFLWKINYSNCLHVETPQTIKNGITNPGSYYAYVGPGNNSYLIKCLLKRRSWWTVYDQNSIKDILNQTNKNEKAIGTYNNMQKYELLKNFQFVWTQLKEAEYHNQQNHSKNENILDKNESLRQLLLNSLQSTSLFFKNRSFDRKNHDVSSLSRNIKSESRKQSNSIINPRKLKKYDELFDKSFVQYKNIQNNKNLRAANVKKNRYIIKSEFASIHQQGELILDNTSNKTKIHIRQNDIFLDEDYQNEKRLVDPHQKIFSQVDLYNWNNYYHKNQKYQQSLSQQIYAKRVALYEKKPIKKLKQASLLKVHNHFQHNFYIGNKKALFYNLHLYYSIQNKNPFQECIPLTFHITKGIQDPQYQKFLQQYAKIQQKRNEAKTLQQKQKAVKNIWIVKPGQNTNRGSGISVCYHIDDVKMRLRGRQKNRDGKYRTFIIQKYIDKPLLYNNRKFDIRHYMLVTCINGIFKGYWYDEGYIRTSSHQFTIKSNKNPFIHLTNDAIQKNGSDYGKFEKGNKISYSQFQKYLNLSFSKTSRKNKQGRKNAISNIDTIQQRDLQYDFYEDILPKMKQIGRQSIKATYNLLDQNRREHNFELLGLDFMIDQNMKPWLIEVNTNPCLQTSCPLLQRLIPVLIQNVLRLTIDSIFVPPENVNCRKMMNVEKCLNDNKFNLVFDEYYQGRQVEKIFKDKGYISLNDRIDNKIGDIELQDSVFQQLEQQLNENQNKIVMDM